jgi:hypothetical protein
VARAIAEAGILGLPVDRFIRSRDPEERALLDRARHEGFKVLDGMMDALARKIVKETADAQERGRKKKGGKK